jgi:hypothetical protein
VLSVVLVTDTRDPANMRATPAWQVALRTGMQEIAEQQATREQRLALRALHDELERELSGLPADRRGRGLVWLINADRSLDQRFAVQLRPAADVVRWDARPYVLPLLELVGRGRPATIVLVASDSVRLLRWEQGEVSEPERSLYDLELGDWRQYAAYAAANPTRGQQTATHIEAYEQRVEAWRERFLRQTGAALAGRLGELGASRVLLAGERGLTTAFTELLPSELADQVISELDVNLIGEEPAAIGDRFEAPILSAWVTEARAFAEQAVGAARAGRPAALGADETLQALQQARVERLVLDPRHRFRVEQLGTATARALRVPEDAMIAECAVELALASSADVTVISVADAPTLADADGMAATLRY